MHLAIIDNKHVAAAPGLQGLCPGCMQPVIARCGTKRIHHWSHRNSDPCDSWWEPETEWHRAWKNNFPVEWQEKFLPDEQTGEKHIADVCTSHGLVIEFQHSAIDPKELCARENVYKNMVWVVDGTRLKKDYPRFLNGTKSFRSVSKGVFRVSLPGDCFPPAWLGCSAPVIFDFRGNETIDDPRDTRHGLYLLFPLPIGRDAIVAVMSRKEFIDTAINGTLLPWMQHYMNSIKQVSQELKGQQQPQINVNVQRRNPSSPYIISKGRFIKRRRF